MKNYFIALISFLVSIHSYGQTKFALSGDVFGRRVFIKNNGQFDAVLKNNSKVLYAYLNGQEKVYFHPNGLTYALQKKQTLTEHEREALEHGKKINFKEAETYFVTVSWENANPNIEIIEDNKQSYYHSFGDAKYKSECYKKITYKNVYNQIDIEYIFTNERDNGLKYNVIVHPGGNVNDVKINYTGDVKKLSLKDGNVIIKTPLQNITELAPESYQEDSKVNSHFLLQDNVISFNFPNGYDNTKELVIDPWVVNLTLATNNCGYDVDYDYAGNYYVYGGTGPYLIAKYSPVGNLVWTFAGTVASLSWPSLVAITYPGNFLVDKISGKSYSGEGFDTPGTTIIRLDANGLYDNFISTVSNGWNELWDMGFDCSNGTIFGLGGSITNNTSAGILNALSGAITSQNFSGIPGTGQDIVSHAIDPNGNIFLVFASGQTPVLNNKIMLINATFNGNIWTVPSTYTSFTEAGNKSGYPGFVSSNGYNALAANANFLYYYDGLNLAAYNKATGAKIGSTTLIGQNVMEQGGIAVDDCDNVYVGGNGSIKCYNFNGTSFTANGTIPLGVTTLNQYVTDIQYAVSTNELYISGTGFGGVYSAINSITCTVIQTSVTTACVGSNNGSAVATVSTNFVSPIISYSWTNSSNVIVSQTLNSTLLTNTATGLANGNYTVYSQVNAPCGPVKTQTFTINCVCSLTALATSTCASSGVSTSLTLGATNGLTTTPITYLWSGPGAFASTNSNTTIANAATGVYTLTATTPSCSASGTVLVTAPSSFTPVLTSTNVTCFNGTNGTSSVSAITGTSSAPYTYSWTSIPIQTNPLAINLVTGNYTCYVTDNNGCTYSATTTITQPAQAFLTLSNTSVSCYNGSNGTASVASVPITNTSPYTYTWSTTPVQNSPQATGLTVGTYSCALTDNIGCVFTGTTTITQPAQAFLTLSNTSVSCYNGSNGTASVAVIPIANTSPYTYTWSTTPVQNSPQATGLTIGTYSCALTDNIGCVFTGTTTIIQPAQAFLTLSNTSVSCNNGSNGTASVAVIPIANTSPYTYTWSTTPVQNSPQATSLTTGTYSCALTDNIGCVFTGTTTITQPTSVSVTVNSSTNQACANSSITLSASGSGGSGGGYTYLWSNNSTTFSTSVTESSGGSYTYSLSIYDANSCSVTAVKSVSFIPNPVLTTNNTSICEGEFVTLAVNGASTYSWSPAMGLSSTVGGVVTASPPITTVYSIQGNNQMCTASINLTVTVVTYPNLIISCPEQQICYGSSTQIFASGAQTYSWSPANIFLSPIQTTAIVSPLSSSEYTIIGSNSTGTTICSAKKMMPIIVVPKVTAGVSEDKVICFGEQATFVANGGNTFSWTPSYGLNTTTASAVVSTATANTIYTVNVASDGVCSDNATVSLIVNPLPKVNAGRDTTYNLGDLISITAIGNGSVSWVSGESIGCKDCPTTQILPSKSGCYVAQVSNEFGCKALDEVCIEVTTDFQVYIPNSFTPNDDGLNDVFLVYGYSISDVKLDIFDRWGTNLFSSANINKGWNGTYQDKACEIGVYVYKISYKGLDNKKYTKTGHVTLHK